MKRLKALASPFGVFLKWVRRVPAFIGWVVLAFVLVSAVVLGSLYYYIYHNRNNLPDIEPFIKFEPPAIGEAYDSRGQVIIGLAKEYRRINRYSDLPPVIVQAVLSAEDKRFFRHYGVDYLAILQAAAYSGLDSAAATGKSWEKEKYTIVLQYSHGGSTLDQQLVKLYFQTGKTDSLRKKLEKIRLAVWLNEEMEKRYGMKAKEEIFARFVSFVYLGNGRYGFGAGAEHFFGKSIKDFDPSDVDKAAFLAGLVRHPFPSKNPRMEKYVNRRNEVLEQMAENGFVNQNALKELVKREVVLAGKTPKTIAPSAVSDMLEELNDVGFTDMEMFEGKISVYTAIDLKIQEIANQALENGLVEYERRHPEHIGKTQGAAVVMANDGRVLAVIGGRKMYNGRPYRYSDLNRTNRLRQIGSSFKPFVYLTAFEEGYEPTDHISDSPYPISMGYGQGLHWVNNYDNKSLGVITLCEALYRSRNAPTVRLTIALGSGSFKNSGMKKVIDTARTLGVKSPFHSDTDHLGRTVYYPTSALGASEMTLIELTNAYREIASGISVEPYMIQRVVAKNGETVFEKSNKRKLSAIDPRALEMTRHCLRKVITQPGGTAYSLTVSNFPVSVIGKTGTTDDFRNALFIGSTYGLTGITVGAEINFDDNTELGDSETGARTALPIFKEIMEEVYGQGLVEPTTEFPPYIPETPDNAKISDPQ